MGTTRPYVPLPAQIAITCRSLMSAQVHACLLGLLEMLKLICDGSSSDAIRLLNHIGDKYGVSSMETVHSAITFPVLCLQWIEFLNTRPCFFDAVSFFKQNILPLRHLPVSVSLPTEAFDFLEVRRDLLPPFCSPARVCCASMSFGTSPCC